MAAHESGSTHRKLKILVSTAVIAVLLVGGAYVGWKVRKGMMIRAAFAEGNAAYERGDWETARRMLGRYVSVHPEDVAVLARYAQANLSVRPLPQDGIRQAMGAYRLILRAQPNDELAFRRLALLYETTGNAAELEYIAGKRLEAVPDDPAATVARAKALIYLEKQADGRAALEALVAPLTAEHVQQPELIEALVLLSALDAQAVPLGGDAAREAAALGWLNRALEHDPDSALAHVQRATLVRTLSERARRPLSEADAVAIRRDLEEGEKPVSPDPRVRLALSEEWMAQGAYERAAAQLESAGQIDPESLTEFYVDPGDWVAALFGQKAKLALLTRAQEQGGQLAQDTLDRFKDRPQRAQILPLALELFVVARRMPDAHQALDEFLEAAKLLRTNAALEEQAAYLQALVAGAENEPYRVIDLLAPVADRATTRPLIRTLLADAYSRTGQLGRAAKVLAKETAGRPTGAEGTKQLARLYLGQGAWGAARDVLGSLTEPQRDVDAQVLELAARLGLAGQELPEQRARALDSLADELAKLRDADPERVAVRILLASIAEQQGRPDAAAAELQRASAECPDPLPALMALSRLHAGAGQVDEALQTLRAACERSGEHAMPWLALSDLLANRARVDEARAALRTAAEAVASPEDKRRIAVALATLDLRKGEVATGIAALRALAAEDPQDIQARALLLELPQILQDQPAAQQLVDEIRAVEGNNGLLWRLHQARLWLAAPDRRARQNEIVELVRYCTEADPTRTGPLLLLGGLYEEAGDFASAEAVYSSGFKTSGAPEIADRLLALLQRQRRFSEARTLLDQLKQKLDERLVGTWRLALAVGQGQYGEAINELELRLTAAQKDPLDLVRLAGLSYAQTRDADRALEYLEQAAAAGGDRPTVARTRVAILKAEKRFDEAERVLTELVEAQPLPEAYLLRASYHTSVGHPDLAEQDYRALLQVTQDGFGHAALGEFYAQTKRLDQAIATWLQGLELYPDSAQLKRGLTKALLTRNQAGDRELAGKFLAELEQNSPDDTDLLWVRAVRAVGEGTPERLAEARELLRQAARSLPASAEAYRGLVELAIRLEDFATARDLADRGTQVNPGDAGLLLLRARAELALNNLEAARQAAWAARQIDGKNPAALDLIIEIASRRQDTASLQSAQTAVEQLLREQPDSEAWQVLRARALVALRQPDAALAGLEAFTATDAGRASVLAQLFLHDLYRTKGDATAAQRALDTASALAPDHLGVLHARLVLLAEAKRYDEIVALATAQQDSDRPRPEILLSAATMLGVSPAHLDAAVQLCQRAVELAPGDVRPHLSLGELAYGKGEIDRAVQAYRAALQLNPSQPEALNNLAWILAEKRAAYGDALAYARAAVVLRPNDANFRDTLAFILRKMPDKLEEARNELRRCAELAGAGSALRARSLFHLAQVCYALNDWAPIAGHLNEALATEKSTPVFTPEERAEIERLLQTIRDTSQVSAAEQR